MHSLLTAALDAVPPAERPPPPYHGGVDANPQLGAFGYAGSAIYVAESSEMLVVEAERARWDRWLDAARGIYAKHARSEGEEVKVGTKTKLRTLPKKELSALQREVVMQNGGAGRTTKLPLPLVAANVALYAACDAEAQGGGSDVTSAVRHVLARVASAIPRERMRSFALDLDRVLLREELRAVLARRRDPRCEHVDGCVWRAAEGRARAGRASGAQVTHWIGRLDDGSYVLVWKVGARWEVSAGARDDVLATVPDTHMESAVMAVVGRTK